MWFYSHRHSLTTVAIAAVAALLTAVGGPDEAVHALAGALMAMISVSLFNLYEPPPKK